MSESKVLFMSGLNYLGSCIQVILCCPNLLLCFWITLYIHLLVIQLVFLGGELEM